jgi:hypothetical protein
MAARSRTASVAGVNAPKAAPEMGMPKDDGVVAVFQNCMLFIGPPPSVSRAPVVPGPSCADG